MRTTKLFGETKIGNFNLSITADKDIFWLQILIDSKIHYSVENVVFMQKGQSLQYFITYHFSVNIIFYNVWDSQ